MTGIQPTPFQTEAIRAFHANLTLGEYRIIARIAEAYPAILDWPKRSRTDSTGLCRARKKLRAKGIFILTEHGAGCQMDEQSYERWCLLVEGKR